MFFNFFRFCLTISVPQELKILIFEMQIFPQTLNINNLKTTSAKSISMHTIGKLIKYSLKSVRVKTMFTLTVFEILLLKGRLVLSPGTERVNMNFLSVQSSFFVITSFLSSLTSLIFIIEGNLKLN